MTATVETNVGFFISPSIEIRHNQFGVGIYARKHIRTDTVIEQSPCILMKESEYTDESILDRYVFECESFDCDAIGLGYTSLFNHANIPNADYDVIPYYDGNLDKFRAYIRVVAVENIKINSEIFINYGYDPE